MIDLKIDVRTGKNVAVIRTAGYINHHNAEKLADECDALIKKGFKRFVMNLSGSKIINSMGIAVILDLLEKLLNMDGALVFCSLTSVVSRVFKIMGLTRYSKIYDDEALAVAALEEI